MDAPVGFAQSELAEDPYQDHVGVRVGYVDDSGRELHVFSGIPGEFGEGLPQVDQLSASGSPAALLGRGKVRVLS
ncbi:MAG TPA: hypothetical protein VE646_13295 [Actinomycetota bacterium]|jgi:hypothetical protein|nr:hypothetical protein [Actinomycetota bacterium]